MIDIRLTRRFSRPAEVPPAECEWLVTDGCGGYAGGTLAGCNTRKYHGMLVANLAGAANGRHVLVSSLGDTVEIGGPLHELSGHAFRGAPSSCALPSEFSSRATANWTWRLDGVKVERTVSMTGVAGSTLIRYTRTDAPVPVRLRLAPSLAFRRNHTLSRANACLRPAIDPVADGFCVSPYEGMPSLRVRIQGGAGVAVEPRGVWIEKVHYACEEERGYDACEDLFVPAALTVDWPEGTPLYVALSTVPIADLATAWRREETRRRATRRRAAAFAETHGFAGDEAVLAENLCLAADQLLITAPPVRPTVIAGYPWFEDWGRDTLISLPGLTFARGELEQGLAILRTFASFAKGARLPNYIGPCGAEPSYNSVDAALWFFWAVQQYLACGGGRAAVHTELWPVLKQLLAHMADGSDPLIAMTADGLLRCGDRDTQLTWMDAAIDGRPVTPRWGLPVEINALWYNALCLCAGLAAQFGDTAYRAPVAPAAAAAAFERTFWLPELGYLADAVNEEGVSREIRPNQIFAVSLPFSALSTAQARAVVATVETHLLTPRGLRTLAPGHPDYRGHYGGGTESRDHAYHQGTVWPWLMGAFGEAYLRVAEDPAAARTRLREWLAAWVPHLCEAGIGSISEVFDGDAPHQPNGCTSQAWSVAELLRLQRLCANTEPHP